jgi:hypothetical protein
MFQEAMLASAKSKAHKAFKNVNYLVATKNYDEVCFCLLFVEVDGHIGCSEQGPIMPLVQFVVFLCGVLQM